jgi:tRNA threonylcarbamoyladenosine biosynthesis protein TsaE
VREGEMAHSTPSKGSGSLEVVCETAEATMAVGEAVGSLALPGDVILVHGELGAGKTTFVRGAARALGVREKVASPSFVLVRQYRGSFPVLHVDVYRLEKFQEVIELGLEDILDPHAVVFVEWGEAVEPLFPQSHLKVRLEVEGSSRRLRLSSAGGAWADRWEALARRVRKGSAC